MHLGGTQIVYVDLYLVLGLIAHRGLVKDYVRIFNYSTATMSIFIGCGFDLIGLVKDVFFDHAIVAGTVPHDHIYFGIVM